ncbi:hypothetical protein LX15_005556 [Streptoalloteichus tenebrarius]|uniref:Uncharacterized protein n=1 Tax=Streptoalloteichus tenebrarius (strain ATCC 17920 / DSM 40477 / JCM 4838 / CBS 697.72 / NBRC 16177 / NCIMB 11028 / NRRL B-12390 / A12253. 1 / ISP 5477) TaxID=1933 RepID=A0ABT1I232_STRSD|nr:hypothetical protein [Streptoalloteichus tenebrarius]MCP2261829.1 hypothetical protein [Streptoalloteichus tenebrarius]BFE99973.1 hypothetical protein GCM10020241_16490 [Streptoalloteichus tenebrarius]
MRQLRRRTRPPPTLDYDFLEWHRERVALLTNLTARELPDTPVSAERLPDLPLLCCGTPSPRRRRPGPSPRLYRTDGSSRAVALAAIHADVWLGNHSSLAVEAKMFAYVPDNSIADTGLA